MYLKKKVSSICMFAVFYKKIDTYSFGWKIRTKRTGYIPSVTCLP